MCRQIAPCGTGAGVYPMDRHGSRTAALPAFLALSLALSLFLLAASGCISSSPGHPGAWVKITTTIEGYVIDAAPAGQPIAAARVYIPVQIPADDPPGATVKETLETYTDSAGHFTLDGVPLGSRTVGVTPPAESGFGPIWLQVEAFSAMEDLVVRLVPQAYGIVTVTVVPAQVTVPFEGTYPFTAEVRDASGALLPDVTPTWSTVGAIGSIDGDGVFGAGSTSALGQVRATLGEASGYAEVRVAAPSGPGQGGVSP